MNRTLVHENQDAIKIQLKDVESYLPLCNSLKTSFENLNIGSLTEQDYNDCLNNIDTVKTRFIDHLRKELDKAKVTHGSLRNQLINGSMGEFEDLQSAVEKLKGHIPKRSANTVPHLSFDAITYRDGAFVIADLEALKEQFRVYREPEDDALFEEMERFAEAYSKLYEKVKATGMLPKLKNVGDNWLNLYHLFQEKDGQLSVNPGLFEFTKRNRKFTTNK